MHKVRYVKVHVLVGSNLLTKGHFAHYHALMFIPCSGLLHTKHFAVMESVAVAGVFMENDIGERGGRAI